MFGSNIVDMVIGLVFVFLIMSLICSALREMVETALKQRALDLERGIRELLQDPHGEALARELYLHPLVYGLYEGVYRARSEAGSRLQRWFGTGGQLPSYIPNASFARALIDLDQQGKVQSPPVVAVLRSLAQDTAGDIAQLRANIESWFEASGERISGWYKRRTQVFLFAIGFGTAAALNVNALVLASELYHQSQLRTAIAASAETFAATGDPATGAEARAAYDSSMTQLHKLAGIGLPMGWDDGPARQAPLYVMMLGWLITAVAVTLGAPFWFDLLNKFVTLRSTVKPREKRAAPDSAEPAPSVAATFGEGRAVPQSLNVTITPRTAAVPEVVPANFQPHEWAHQDEDGVI